MERYTEVCGDNRFELIKKYKEGLVAATNIETAIDEMNVIDSILFRFWQMGWLDKYKSDEDGLYVEFFAVKDGVRHNAKIINLRDMLTIMSRSLTDSIDTILELK